MSSSGGGGGGGGCGGGGGGGASADLAEMHLEQEGLNVEEWKGLEFMESLCMSCGENGRTTYLLHKIPFFKELIIASFHCPSCGDSNNEVTFGGEIQETGCIIELKVTSEADLNRQLIKSDSATVRVLELEFEIPPQTQKGDISTIEGVLKCAAKNLGMYQEERMEQMPEVGAKVGEVIMNLLRMATGSFLPFTIHVDDPAGNSFIENPTAPAKDPFLSMRQYKRSAEQDMSLGLKHTSDGSVYKDDKETNFQSLGNFGKGAEAAAADVPLYPRFEDEESIRLGKSEVISIPSPCPNCTREGESLTAITQIPHFKEVIIMAFNCEHCGFRQNEVKGGGAVPALGSQIKLFVRGPEDLKRDVLKSDSAMIHIPELDLELVHGSLGGVYTTIEGLINKIYTNLRDNNPFAVGDSATQHHGPLDTNPRFLIFLDRLQSFAKGEEFPFTLILRDPLDNSFVSAPLGSFLPPDADPGLEFSEFERTFDENEEFGLNDLNTRDFETGVDHDEVILADRISHVVAKGVDHPTPFATGTFDETPGGFYIGKSQNRSVASRAGGEEEEDGGESYFETPPLGVSAARHACNNVEDYNSNPLPVVVEAASFSKRNLGDDSALADRFEAREEFAGRRPGFVFRLGSLGLGYYFDIHAPTPRVVAAEEEIGGGAEASGGREEEGKQEA